MTKSEDTAARGGRREEILSVATSLFAVHGVEAVTTRQIARAVGISQPSIYAHFASVQQIRDELSTRAFALLERQLATAHDSEPAEALRRMIQSYLDFGFANPQAYRIAFMLEHPKTGSAPHEGHDMEGFAAVDHPGPRAFGHFMQTMARARPDLGADMRLMRTQCLWASLHGLMALLMALPDFPWADRDALVAEHSRLAFQLAMI